MFREYEEGENYISFFSNAKFPLHKLSNFAECEIIFNGKKYISTEHAFQSRKYIKEDRKRFRITGDLGNIDGFNIVFDEKDVENKINYWMKKKNIGIIAKMATDKKRGVKLGLNRDENFESDYELWEEILLAKFSIDEFKEILLNTGNKYLLEFSRNAKNRNDEYWGGIIENGKLYGKNMMGKYLMKIREKLRKK